MDILMDREKLKALAKEWFFLFARFFRGHRIGHGKSLSVLFHDPGSHRNSYRLIKRSHQEKTLFCQAAVMP
ncbi:hypothetical protein [Undibacterium sp. WLX3042]|uniref:hypothetical protein n=1 Tax=Undibacterium sp. WLX3042 TaxID=3412686 RepID=UPI003C2CF565